MINQNNFSTGVEVGAATGITTAFLLKHCPSLQSLTVVDLWEPVKGSHAWDREDMESLFRSKFEGERKLTILKGISWEMADHIADGTLDFAFVDASHDYDSVIKDIKAWYPKVRNGGMLCGHDLHFPDVSQATEDVFGGRVRKVGIDNMWYVNV
jgi:predicted O-methyltransferase YrrM